VLWVVAGGAIIHEVSQELSDYLLLVTRGNLGLVSLKSLTLTLTPTLTLTQP
tara:strand:+ start:125 stop:280 length:156 start_codon:yes stop_codon:yes gene_type:complete